MLAGRESLVRLIGKRRRTLPPDLCHLLESFSPDFAGGEKPSSSTICASSLEAKESSEAVSRDGDSTNGADSVSCPVCGCSIRGTDYIINSHLDMCLTGKKKRKLTQSTLLQFNFCPNLSGGTCLTNLNNPPEGVKETVSSDVNGPSNDHQLVKSGSIRNYGGSQFVSKSCGLIQCNLETCYNDSMENMAMEDVSCKIVDPSNVNIHCQNLEIPECGNHQFEDAELAETIETFIIGRRFHQNVGLQQGANISILRDPENAKDKNAIKVLYADSGCEQILGYLPRDLARNLSPLIDKYQITCQGFVASLPEHPFDAVPIRLTCSKHFHMAMKSEDVQTFKSLWKNVIQVVDDAKTACTYKYQQNFCVLVQDVLYHHAHLFTEDEKSFLGSFNLLSNDAQRLFIRLYTRKGPWFRMATISYPGISNLQKAVHELQLTGYVDAFLPCDGLSKHDMKDVLNVLTVPEMREILNQKLSKKRTCSARREELFSFLYSAYENGSCPLLPMIVAELVGICVKISSASEMLMWRVQRLFFLNGEQDLSAFLLVDLGVVKFPDYSCNASHPIFPDRNCLLAYEEAISVAQLMDQSLDEHNMEMILSCIHVSERGMNCSLRDETGSSSDCPPMFYLRFSASWVYSKVLLLGASVFEHEHRYEDAVRLLRVLLSRYTYDSRRGYWTVRLSTDLEHLGCLEDSLSIAEEGVLDPWVRAGSKMALQRRVIRLGKPPRRWKLPSFAESVKRKIKEVNIIGRPLNCETGAKNTFYGYDGELCGVEQLALQYYAEGGNWQGIHSESGVWLTIFGLLMWDIIFCNLPNVFHNKFQMAPLDLDTDDFYVARESLIESHLQKIKDGMAEEILIISWESHLGTACQGVNWDQHSLSELRAIVSCIGGHCLASLCCHLALDYRNWSSGMPDLLLWRFNGGDQDGGEAKLVEVKGPRDRLSEQQRAWMLLLMDCGFDTELCKVRPVTEL